MTRVILISGIALAMFATAYSTTAQTNVTAPAVSKASQVEVSEQLRDECIAKRRSICGKILRIFPDGILVESGYTNLLRKPLTKSWLVPGSVVASRAPNLVESTEPGALCVGTVFLNDLPTRRQPHQYDYVIIAGYPTGEYTYTSVGTLKKTVRRFSANLDKAVTENLDAGQGTGGKTAQ